MSVKITFFLTLVDSYQTSDWLHSYNSSFQLLSYITVCKLQKVGYTQNIYTSYWQCETLSNIATYLNAAICNRIQTR